LNGFTGKLGAVMAKNENFEIHRIGSLLSE